MVHEKENSTRKHFPSFFLTYPCTITLHEATFFSELCVKNLAGNLQIASFTKINSKMVVGSSSWVGYLNEQLVCIGAGKGIRDKRMRKEALFDGLRLEVLAMLQIAVQFEDRKWLRTQKGEIR
ncbi:hypothetical protein FCM35_KLT01177 [Carex littledalei]|uniref:Uncharacterized protein n=1 Tax=Carex littledalei TaxID=544730 RepID=A0A833RC98_9POAL|nr:hypothetical protein FCM35_KLT01177 [Carex littledalei]